MDLIYANGNHEDIGVLHDYKFDLAFGSENDFSLTVDKKKHCCEAGYYIYIDRTEYGGIIDAIEVSDSEVVYKGRSWHGVLGGKILVPDAGANYLTASGDANEILAFLINRIGLSDSFRASTGASGLNISGFQFNRYTDAYTGIIKMLKSANGKLIFTYKDGKVELSALPIVDYSIDEQFDSDQISLKIDKSFNSTNHLICLGKGELAQRQVIHLYADAQGNISTTQSITGINEIVDVYDYSSAESLDELQAGGIEKLQEAQKCSVSMDFDAEATVYDIGDIVGSKDIITGIEVTAAITGKTITINKGKITIQYKVGE